MLKKILCYVLLFYIFSLFALVIYLSSENNSDILNKASEVNTPNFIDISDTTEKKMAFIQFLLPIIERENKRINLVREQLLYIQIKKNNAKKLTLRERHYLQEKLKRYDIEKTWQDESAIKDLLKKINTLPSSLAIAQAAIESGWGTSRFAREANNYFGQWCYKKGCGLKPSKRNKNAKHEVRKFSSIQESVAAYMFNINTHRAYKALRDTRQRLHERGETVTGSRLAEDLLSYSELGEKYVLKVQRMIKLNKKLMEDS